MKRLPILCFSLVFAGCGGESEATPVADTGLEAAPTDAKLDTAEDTARPDTLTSDASDSTPDSDAGTICSTLTVGAAVTVTAIATEPPALVKGDALVEGVYDLTAATEYTGVGGATGSLGTMRRSMRLEKGQYEAVRQDGDGPHESYKGTFTLDPPSSLMTFKLDLTCPYADKVFGNVYETTSTGLKMYVGGSTAKGVRLLVMTRR